MLQSFLQIVLSQTIIFVQSPHVYVCCLNDYILNEYLTTSIKGTSFEWMNEIDNLKIKIKNLECVWMRECFVVI